VFVRRRIAWGGWTVNFGHDRWLPALMAVIAAPALTLAMSLALGIHQLGFMGLMVLVTAGVIWVIHWEESRPRD